MSEGVYSRELVASVRRIEYDFEARTGFLHMPRICYTDMTGCLELFQRIDPEVRAIYTFSGPVEDVAYFKEQDGRWSAVTARMSDAAGPLRPIAAEYARGR